MSNQPERYGVYGINGKTFRTGQRVSVTVSRSDGTTSRATGWLDYISIDVSLAFLEVTLDDGSTGAVSGDVNTLEHEESSDD